MADPNPNPPPVVPPGPLLPPPITAPPGPTPFMPPPAEEKPKDKMSLCEYLNHVRCYGIALTDGIGLGDALMILSRGVGRTGVRLDELGNKVVQKAVNENVGKLLEEALSRIPRAVDVVNAQLGYDRERPM